MSDYNYNVGKKHEWFVRQCFCKNVHLSVAHHNDDKKVNGILPLINLYPDLLFKCDLKGRYQYVAVECKRRTRNHYTIDVCKESQLVRYRQNATSCPTYIFLSIGGPIYHPWATYLIPIDSVKPKMTQTELEEFARDYNQLLFFHTDTGRITY